MHNQGAVPRQRPGNPVMGAAVVGAGIAGDGAGQRLGAGRSEEHTSELQSLMRISYAVFCLKKKKKKKNKTRKHNTRIQTNTKTSVISKIATQKKTTNRN